MKKNKLTYTAKEVNAYRDRLFRQHMQERVVATTEAYERGLRDGANSVRQTIKAALVEEPDPADRE
jgi:hypothetical protein